MGLPSDTHLNPWSKLWKWYSTIIEVCFFMFEFSSLSENSDKSCWNSMVRYCVWERENIRQEGYEEDSIRFIEENHPRIISVMFELTDWPLWFIQLNMWKFELATTTCYKKWQAFVYEIVINWFRKYELVLMIYST